MEKWQRSLYQPNLPLGADGTKVTASKAHITLSKEAAKEGMVLLKNNESLLPFQAGTKLALFGKGSFDYVKGGGGSGDVTVAYTTNLYEGFKKLPEKVEVYEALSDYYRKEVEKQYEASRTGNDSRACVSGRNCKKSESVHGHGSDLHQPFFRGRLGQKEFL